MFGLIIAGRLVQTEFEQVAEKQVVFSIPEADDVNHIVVFMTGQTPFPDGIGGTVYFCWPSSTGPTWYLLGHISNAKPSAIFKVCNLKTEDVSEKQLDPFGQLSISAKPSHVAQIGISAEPLDVISQQTPAAKTTASTVDSLMEFSTKMLQNFTNYAMSFSVTQAQMLPNPSDTFVPMRTLTKWFENFQRRLQQNPNFWKT